MSLSYSVNQVAGLGWMGANVTTCAEAALKQKKDKIRYYYEVSQSGGGVKTGNPLMAEYGAGDIININCGRASFLLSDTTGYDILHYVQTSLSSDLGRIQMLYDESVEITNLTGEYDTANGTYLLTTFFKNNKPTYKNENGWWLWWNGTDWSLTDSINSPTKTLKNGDGNINGGVWDCDPSCQQGGRGPESPPISCVPSEFTNVPHHVGTQLVEGIGTLAFGDAGSFGFNPADFPDVKGLPRLYKIKDPTGFQVVSITAAAYPNSGTEPMVYFDCTSSHCAGKCYGGKLKQIPDSENWEANLSLLY